MKKNTQKILLSLYSKENQLKNRVPLSNLELVVPGLTAGGFRSLLHVLKKQGSITTQRALGLTTVSITHHGTVLIEAEFPALSKKWDTWQGDWDCLVFIESTSSDKQFRYLRKLLIDEGAISISRGVYMSPGGFSDLVVSECNSSYQESVIIFSVGSWKIATDSALVIEKYGLLDLAEAYSGVSKDVSRLLKSVNSDKRLISRHKTDISLVYDRVCQVFADDPGFCTFYFPEAPKVKESLIQLNSLISR